MSRVGRNPIPIPDGVTVSIEGNHLTVNGKLGELHRELPEGITAALEGGVLTLQRREESKQQRAFHGLSRALLANMVKGTSQGFKKDLELVGIGYRVEQKGKAIMLAVGYSHRIVFIPPENITIKVNGPTAISVSGIDNQLVGEVAAKIRQLRPPEPYKGKGIKYVGEYIRRKAGKTTAK